jgi:hypothetical protein
MYVDGRPSGNTSASGSVNVEMDNYGEDGRTRNKLNMRYRMSALAVRYPHCQHLSTSLRC